MYGRSGVCKLMVHLIERASAIPLFDIHFMQVVIRESAASANPQGMKEMSSTSIIENLRSNDRTEDVHRGRPDVCTVGREYAR